MLHNFLYRVGEYARDNYRKLINWAIVAVSIFLAVLLIYGAIESFVRSRSYKRINELEQQYRQAEARAKDFQTQADVLKAALDLKYAEISKLKEQAAAADAAVARTRRESAPLKERYEEARNTPTDNTLPAAADLSCSELCKELSGLGHPCR